MLLLQSIARDDAQQAAGTSTQSWGGFLAKLVGWPFGPDVQTSVEKTGPSRIRGMAIAERDQQARDQNTSLVNDETMQAQNLSQRLLKVAAELPRTRAELTKANDANGNLQRENAELKREVNMLRGSTNRQQENQISGRGPSPFVQIPVGDLQVLEATNYSLRMRNMELESRITNIVKELQRLTEENDVLQEDLQLRSYLDVEMTKIYRRDMHHIRRRIIVEKMTKVLGNRYGKKSRRESFDNWSRRVRYPGWEHMIDVATRAIKQGNKVAHQATRAELQAAITFGPVYSDEEWEEAEVLGRMLNIIENGGEISEDDDFDDDYDNDLQWP
ncbi:hypothetical protein C0993_011719 [Termitomyces sp. T159_Od127]|nr:hypothetical protein C0993_011719 [Termitomyces sp. T159_Od127]